jgi:hypothetical protein
MKNKFVNAFVMFSVVVLLSSCAKVPQAEIDAAVAAIEDARSTGEFTSKRASDTLNLQASALTVDEMEGLMDLLSSPSVQIYEDEIWKTILIQPGTFNRYESGNLSKVELQAIKVDKQIQSW